MLVILGRLLFAKEINPSYPNFLEKSGNFLGIICVCISIFKIISPIHDYIFYILNGSTLQVFDEGGADLGTLDASTGSVFAFKVEDSHLVSVDGKNHRVPATHSAKNVGSEDYREILVETKQV